MNIAGLHLEKPLMNASGTLSRLMVREVKDLYGAVVTKTVTLEPREGNPPPRIAEVACGVINSIGLQNVGIEKFLEEELDEWCAAGLPVIVSVGGERLGDEEALCKRLVSEERVAALELNLSCPNAGSGVMLCQVPEALDVVVRLCKKELGSKGLIVKLGLERARSNAWIAEAAGADALTLINSIPSMVYINGKPFRGGQSGLSIKGIALRAVDEVSRQVKIPLIASGGVSSSEDIEDFMRAGASAVQIGSASFVGEPQEIAGKFEVS